MKNKTEVTEAHRQYAAGHAAHYTEHNLPSAMRLYKQVTASHPSDPKPEYARVQIQNTVKAVVPEQELLDAQMQPALVHIEHSA